MYYTLFIRTYIYIYVFVYIPYPRRKPRTGGRRSVPAGIKERAKGWEQKRLDKQWSFSLILSLFFFYITFIQTLQISLALVRNVLSGSAPTSAAPVCRVLYCCNPSAGVRICARRLRHPRTNNRRVVGGQEHPAGEGTWAPIIYSIIVRIGDILVSLKCRMIFIVF